MNCNVRITYSSNKNKKGLLELNITCCKKITNNSILKVSRHYKGLESLSLANCKIIKDYTIILLAQICKS